MKIKKPNFLQTKANGRKSGFSLVEIVAVIAVLAILAVFLVPSLMRHTEKSRAQRDSSAMDEVVGAVQMALLDPSVYDEVLRAGMPENASCYIDTDSEIGHDRIYKQDGRYMFGDTSREKDEVRWYAAGNMSGVTITFAPALSTTQSQYVLANGVINKFLQGDSVTLGDMKNLLAFVSRIVGSQITQTSQTYRNSEYTVFIGIGTVDDEVAISGNVEVYGQYSGTNLDIEEKDYYMAFDRDVSDPTVGTENGSGGCNHVWLSIADAGFIKTKATCVAKAVYYQSCSACGTKSFTRTFEGNGFDSTNHVGGTSVSCVVNDEATHIIKTTCNGCGVVLSSKTEAHSMTGGRCGKCGYGTTYVDFVITSENRHMIGYTSETEDLVIPETFQDADGTWYRVVGIDDYAFDCCNLISVIIPDSVIGIGEDAFMDCTDLTSVDLGNGVQTIGVGAFASCPLTSIFIPKSVTYVGSRAFGSSSVKSIVVDVSNTVYHANGNCLIETASKTLIMGCSNSIIPSDGSVEIIGEWAFSGCYGLTDITIPNGVTAIECGAFYNCNGLASITIPDSVTTIEGGASIGAGAFEDCGGLAGVTIGGSVASIGDRAFRGCSKLTNITIPNSVTSIGKSAFKWCSGLKNIIIGNSVTAIGEYAFAYCGSLTSITIPNGVVSIGENAFWDCGSLASITLPASLRYVGTGAFPTPKASYIAGADGKWYDTATGVGYTPAELAAIQRTSAVTYTATAPSVKASELAVGDSVWMSVDGILTEFVVVHQGNPDSTIYDASCNGTWLMMKDLYVKQVWGFSDANYSQSSVHEYLNGTFIGLLDSYVEAQIKQVKIPYIYYEEFYNDREDDYEYPEVTKYGADGLSTKVFLLSGCEIGVTLGGDNYNDRTPMPVDGACLEYFNGTSHMGSDAKRVALYGEASAEWWLRTPLFDTDAFVYYVTKYGTATDASMFSSTMYGVRPTFILDSNTQVNQLAGKNIVGIYDQSKTDTTWTKYNCTYSYELDVDEKIETVVDYDVGSYNQASGYTSYSIKYDPIEDRVYYETSGTYGAFNQYMWTVSADGQTITGIYCAICAEEGREGEYDIITRTIKILSANVQHIYAVGEKEGFITVSDGLYPDADNGYIYVTVSDGYIIMRDSNWNYYAYKKISV